MKTTTTALTSFTIGLLLAGGVSAADETVSGNLTVTGNTTVNGTLDTGGDADVGGNNLTLGVEGSSYGIGTLYNSAGTEAVKWRLRRSADWLWETEISSTLTPMMRLDANGYLSVYYNGTAGVTLDPQNKSLSLGDATIYRDSAGVLKTDGAMVVAGAFDALSYNATSGVIEGGATGLELKAGGTNQNVVISPSGSGDTILNGNVGIGTTNTSYAKLTVVREQTSASNAVVADFAKTGAGTYGSSILRLSRSVGHPDRLELELNSGGSGPFRYGTYADANIVNNFDATNGPYGAIHMITNSEPRLTIGGGTLAGNIGIGTTSPASKLDVKVAGGPGIVPNIASIGHTTGGHFMFSADSAGANYLHTRWITYDPVAARWEWTNTSIGGASLLHMGVNESDEFGVDVKNFGPFTAGHPVNLVRGLTVREDEVIVPSALTVGGTFTAASITVLGDSTVQGPLSIRNGTSSLTFGATNGTNVLTNSTTKIGRLLSPHYTNSEKPVTFGMSYSDAGNNYAILGGGTSLGNAATQIRFYTASTTTTPTGSLRATIFEDGDFNLTSSSESTTITTGAITAKSMGLTGNLNIGGTLWASNFSGSSSGTNTGDKTVADFGLASTDAPTFAGVTLNGNSNSGGDVRPTSNDAFDLGSPTLAWRQGFFDDLHGKDDLLTIVDPVVVSSPIDSTDSTTGALTAHSIGVADDLYVGDKIVGGTVFATNTGNAIGSVSTGAAFQAVGAQNETSAIALRQKNVINWRIENQATTGDFRIHDGSNAFWEYDRSATAIINHQNVVIDDSAVSNSPLTGALTVIGGAGVGGDLNVAGTISASNFLGSVTGTNTGDKNAADLGLGSTDNVTHSDLSLESASPQLTLTDTGTNPSTIMFEAAGNSAYNSVIGNDVDSSRAFFIRQGGIDIFSSRSAGGYNGITVGSGNSTIKIMRNPTPKVEVSAITESTSDDTGALTVAGGIGVGKSLFVGEGITAQSLAVRSDSGDSLLNVTVSNDLSGVEDAMITLNATDEDNYTVGQGQIRLTKNGAGRGDLSFLTRDGSSLQTALTIDSAQNATFAKNINIDDNQYLRFNGGTDGYLGSSTSNGILLRIRDDKSLRILGNGGVNKVTVKAASGDMNLSSTTASTDKDSGALVVEGGVGIEGDLNIGGTFQAANFQGGSAGTPNQFITLSGSNAGTSVISQVDQAASIFLTNTDGGANTFADIIYKDASGNGVAGVAGVFVNDATNQGDLAFTTRQGGSNLSEKMRILGNGNVGIGTTSPEAQLDVAADIRFGNGRADWGDGHLSTNSGWNSVNLPTIGSTGGTTGSLIMLHNPHIPFRTDNGRSYYAGKAGIRMAANAQASIHWDAALGGDFFYIDRMISGTATEFFRITNSGNVGIGTSTPTDTLEVAGTMKVSGATRFDGPVRIAQQGDLDMGAFTAEPN